MAAGCACSAFQCGSRELLSRSARVAYSSLFFLAVVVAWVLRDFAKPLLEKIPWIMRGAIGFEDNDMWFGQQAVFRVSLGNFMFFITMSAILFGVKYKNDKRDQMLHHGNWLLKLGIWILFNALPFFLPNSVIDAYGYAARFGSGLFLVIQMIILLDFVQCWNEAWVGYAEEDPNWLYGLLTVSVLAFCGTLTLAGLMFHWFKPSGAGSCSLNILLITLTLLLCITISALSLAPFARKGSLFPAAIISLYATYLCFSALASEPRDYECNGIGAQITAASGSTLAIGMLATLASVVYAAFRAGSNTHLFSLEGSTGEPVNESEQALLNSEEGLTSAGLDGQTEGAATSAVKRESSSEEDSSPVTYNYSFFHLIFALASMYIAMLMTGWGSVVQEKDRIDVGWTSVFIKIGSEWLTGLLYCWVLIAPALFPDRDFS
jgi:hypothetical protein